MLREYFDRRFSGRFHSSIVHNLGLAAAEAAARGDTAAALAFQQEIDRLREEMAESNEFFVTPRPSKDASQNAFNPNMVAIQWAGLQSENMLATQSACLIDCGVRGRVSITPHGVAFTGGLENDPAAIILAVRHGQLNWPNGIVFHGSAEEGFKTAVAAKMLGVKVKGAKIPRARRAEADALMLEWKPLLDNLRYGSGPARPSRDRSAPYGTILRSSFA